MPLFPGHRYLGPGNSADNGEPVDSDDAIAREHDVEYEAATTEQHIRSSDIKAIRAFGSDFIGTGNWHSAVGAVGLATKYAVESVLGVQYPSKEDLGKRKRENETTPNKMEDNQQPAKRARTEGTPSTSASGDAVLTQTGGPSNTDGTTPGTAAEHTGVAMSATSKYKTGKLVFRHNRMMYSYGYQFKSFTSKYKSDSQPISLTCTPYANVPVDCLPWYMSPS